MSYLLAAWAWVLAHPVLAIAVTTGIASLVYKKLDAYPRWHAVLSLLAGMGLDLPTILDAIRRFYTGSPPTVGKMGPYRTPAQKTDPDVTQDAPSKPAAFMRYVAGGFITTMLVLPFLMSSPACTKAQLQQAVTNLTPIGA
jgi:hypothetical protein